MTIVLTTMSSEGKPDNSSQLTNCEMCYDIHYLDSLQKQKPKDCMLQCGRGKNHWAPDVEN